MATQSDRSDQPEYRSLQAPKPARAIVVFWPAQRPPGRAANEFLKLVSKRFGKTKAWAKS
jgi:hypothetical protein